MAAVSPSQAEQLQTLRAEIRALKVQLLRAEIQQLREAVSAAAEAKEEGF